ncbi:structural maintenance of chromosomes protein 1 [[Candida] jaroonii]|uniref:Structural maintenance of chromosomes protein 1 n=1 Tax=[Candida] jaroonii TaxID=467808 RepID=A0ACA9Y907_9ASCO|nr:structural maintenance of chromosomes protein 1 [[Candida] jaroonii]
MGRLVGLELFNFKSYKGKCSIGFGTSCFTSIIGPNGAGKSNMMDAISFVLGIKSSQLRSQNMKDLIYRGRLDNDVDDVEQEFNNDPTRAHVKIIYEKDDGERMEMKRSINSTGATEYRINNKAVTSLQYSALLKQENILIKARNFLVFQGDVESIASQSPKDLTKLIENISGSNEYTKEFEDLKEELEKAHEYSNSVFSRKRNLSSESKQYKEQMLEQEMFTRKLLDKSNLIKIIHLYKLYHNEKKHNDLQISIDNKRSELEEMNKKLAKEEKAHSKLIVEYSKSSLNLKSEKSKSEKLVETIDSQKRRIIPFESNKKSILSKINNTKSKIKDIVNEIKNQEAVIKNYELKLKEATKLYKNFEDKINASVSSLPTEAHDEYENLRSEFLANGGSQLEEELSLLNNEKDTIVNAIKNFENQIDNSNSTIHNAESRDKNEFKNKLDSINSEINELLATRNEKILLKDELLSKIDTCNDKELKLNSELREILVKLDDLSSKQRESNKQKKLRENLSMLRNLLPEHSIKGFVYELIRPSQTKYEDALITLLGRHIDSVIVDTSVTAFKCIEILKEKRAGIATFIPLDSININSINLNYLRSIHPKAQPGVDIADYDDNSLEQAVQYMIGDALVVDDLTTARKLKWGHEFKLDNKLVTIDASLINRTGLMTGGINSKRYNASVTWDKQELKKLSEVKDDLMIEINKVNAEKPKEMEINMITESIIELDDSLPVLRNQKENLERLLKDKNTEISFLKDSVDKVKESIKLKNEDLAEVDGKISNVERQIKDISKGIFSDFCKKFKFKNGIEDYINIHGASQRIRTKERTQFLKAISTLSNQLEFEKGTLNELISRKESLEEVLSELDSKFNENIDVKEQLEVELDEIIAEYQILKEDITKFENKLSEKQKSINEIESNINEIKTDVTNVGNSILSINELVLKVDIERVNMLKNCQVENILLPLKDGFLDQISLNDTIEELAKEIYEKVEIEYELLNDKLRESYNSKVEAELSVKLESIIEDLEKLTPNAKAAERLKDTENRLRDFDKDFTKARQKESKINEKFNEIKGLRHEKFMNAFEHISGRIDSIYKELTANSSAPLGGSAYLTLEDEDEPYSAGVKYHAMPPSKRFRDMELLSGGEKTIAALALLFAIHSFQPSPFFVLDEVDAALDSSNVNKIANYIKKISSPTFQFIVISLKNTLFEKSDALVGIYREQSENSSRTLTLDLREYPEEENPIVGAAA